MRLQIPDYIKNILDKLEQNGFESFIVGGAVRDLVMGSTPSDYDITTNASVLDIQKIFSRHFCTGIKHGTITVMEDSPPVEITTYRIDGKYMDNRRPSTVIFTDKLAEDLKRRDFTINALAYNPKIGLTDLFEGIADIKNKRIKCIGNARERFNEDALRILRAIRFAAALNFSIEETTLAEICKNKNLLNNISAERKRVELTKLLLCDNNLELLFSTGISNILIGNTKEEVIPRIKAMPKNVALRFAALLKNTADAEQILNNLKFDNKTKQRILNLINLKNTTIPTDETGIKRLLSEIGKDVFFDLMVLFGRQDVLKTTNDILLQKTPIFISDLAINGNDLKEIGINGCMTGHILSSLLDIVINNSTLNKKEILINIAKNTINDKNNSNDFNCKKM